MAKMGYAQQTQQSRAVRNQSALGGGRREKRRLATSYGWRAQCW